MLQSLFANRLLLLLEEYDMKQRELAEKLYITPGAISNYCAGRSIPSIDTLMLIAEIFHTTTDYLLGLTDERERLWKAGVYVIGKRRTELSLDEIVAVKKYHAKLLNKYMEKKD